MAQHRYILGLDTGGTFTDAAIIDAGSGAVLAKAKSATTHHDLALGLAAAITAVLAKISRTEQKRITRVCLSTTLATNAVVEGMGGRVGLVMIGFDDKALGRNNLGVVLGSDPVVFVGGGHHSDGRPQTALDTASLARFAEKHAAHISAIAIAGHFATRNPEHEIAAREYLRGATGLPVSTSHELSSALGGPKRALTAVLNARLINLLDAQITATDAIIAEAQLNAEQMVVKGDGSLVSAEFARIRPVETILSGPAASLSGAVHLSGEGDAIVADIGGTTTDIAVLDGGFPRLSAQGAVIGGWQTMVEAADIRTGGLGGDSEVRLIDRGVVGGVRLGPRRVIPLASLAHTEGQVLKWLEGQLLNPIPSPLDARFILPLFSGKIPHWLTRSEAAMARQCLEAGLQPMANLAQTRLAIGAIERLVARGLLAISAFTPTDSALVLGRIGAEDSRALNTSAAMMGAELMARQRTGAGVAQAADGAALAGLVLERLTVQSCLAVLDSAFAYEGMGEGQASGNAILENLIIKASSEIHGRDAASENRPAENRPERDTAGENRPAENRAGGLVDIGIRLHRPLVALGASAACHYPLVARVLGAKLTVPSDADVAGAVGAAAGSIRQRASIVVTQPSDGVFRVHGGAGFEDFKSLEAALNTAEQMAKDLASSKAEAAGAEAPTLTTNRRITTVPVGGDKTLFIEATIHAIADGGTRR